MFKASSYTGFWYYTYVAFFRKYLIYSPPQSPLSATPPALYHNVGSLQGPVLCFLNTSLDDVTLTTLVVITINMLIIPTQIFPTPYISYIPNSYIWILLGLSISWLRGAAGSICPSWFFIFPITSPPSSCSSFCEVLQQYISKNLPFSRGFRILECCIKYHIT